MDNSQLWYGYEDAPYKKKKKNKKNKKTNHKHDYHSCILEDGSFQCKATYCEICGHIDDIFLFQEISYVDRKILPIFKVDNIWKTKTIDVPKIEQYIVAEEIINGQGGFYSIRVNTDVNPTRFNSIASFDTFEEANKFIHELRNK